MPKCSVGCEDWEDTNPLEASIRDSRLTLHGKEVYGVNLKGVARGVDVVPLLWKFDGFAKKHGIELKAGGKLDGRIRDV